MTEDEKKTPPPEEPQDEEEVTDVAAEEALEAGEEPPLWQEKIAALEAQAKEWQDKYLRAAAEYDNATKRLKKEREEHLLFANEKLLKDLLHIRDNIERALHHAGDVTDLKALREGVTLTDKELKKIFEKFGVTEIHAAGKKFDPQLHEAIQQEPAPNHEPGTVIQEYQKGYLLHGRLLRPARVSVAK